MKPYVTRIAPSPTGMFHLGTARTAYFNWLAARATGGKFLLRIDDTDESRNDEAFTQVIFDAMDWLGLDYDEADHGAVRDSSRNFYRQSDRWDHYRSHVDLLLDKDLAYEDKSDEGTAVRLRMPDLPDTWTDRLVGEVKVSDNHRMQIDGMVIWRSNGSPTYHFASVIDDWSMGVNFVIRGNDHLNNTPRQIAIYKAFEAALGFSIPLPDYAHLGLIQVQKDGKWGKMSKRDNAASLLGFRDAGVDPDAMLNFMLRLGWSPSDANFDKHTKMIDREMATRMFFNDGNMRNAPSKFDQSFLDVLDRRYKAAARPKAVAS